jgi:Flp pilus assembly protein TadG
MRFSVFKKRVGLSSRLHRVGNTGSAAVEFAITAPFMVVLVLGIADYGLLMNDSASLEGATRAVAEYARNSPYCVGAGLTDSNCVAGINNLVSTLKTNNSSLSSATFTPSATISTPGNYCTCTNGYDGGTGNCSTITTAVCTAQVAADPRVIQYIRISATQSINPVVSYGTYTSAKSLNAQTSIRF